MRAQQARKSFRRKKWKITVLEDTWNDLQAAVKDYEGLFRTSPGRPARQPYVALDGAARNRGTRTGQKA